ncbi:MAG: 50S ribosomal protein L30 [Chloroflexi bacterium]|nr:50S ribosomal protein L30 [Chloroflexota bacterium]
MATKTQKTQLIITYTQSVIGYDKRQRGTIRALGLHHLGDVAVHEDNSVIRGMIKKVRHLVTVQEQAA